MTAKLIKHEFLSTARTMPLLYAAMLLTAFAGRILNLFAGSDPKNALLIMLNFVKIMNQLIIWLGIAVTVIVIIQRIYKSVLGKEGYLTMSLPASPRSILIAKLAISLLWSILTFAVATVTYWIYLGKLPLAFSLFFSSEQGATLNLMTVLVLLSIITLLICSIYLSVTIGHLFKSRLPIVYIASAVATFTVIISIVYLVYNFDVINKLLSFLGESTLTELNTYGVPALVFFTLLSLVSFEGAKFILSKRLNLIQ